MIPPQQREAFRSPEFRGFPPHVWAGNSRTIITQEQGGPSGTEREVQDEVRVGSFRDGAAGGRG